MKYPVPKSFIRPHAIEALHALEGGNFPANTDEWCGHALTYAFAFSDTELGFAWWDAVLEQQSPPGEAIEILKEWIAAT
jgi:hypothetical protein